MNKPIIIYLLLLVAVTTLLFNRYVCNKMNHLSPKSGEVWQYTITYPDESQIPCIDSILSVSNGQVHYMILKNILIDRHGETDSMTESQYRGQHHFLR